MGTTSSKSKSSKGKGASGFEAIADKFTTLDQVVAALRHNGLESSNLIVATDFTKSNEWTGKHCFNNRSLHAIGNEPNPYEQAITIIAKTLQPFDDDGLIPAIGFGDSTTQDSAVFNFFHNGAPAHGLEELVQRYRELIPYVKLSGPTSFAPAIYQAMKIVADSGGQYHILLIVADGQVTRPSDMARNMLSRQEQATVDAIVAASQLPLSIVLVGVGDGPWEVMQEFDDKLPNRRWDNFQFVNFTDIALRYRGNSNMVEATFALRALMEIPDQYKLIQKLGLLGGRIQLNGRVQCLQPPMPQAPPPPFFGGPPPASGPSQGFPVYATPSLGGPPPGYPSPSRAPAGDPGGEVDPLFICPITQEVMQDPVIAADGYTYDRASITRWLATHDTSPMSNAPMPHKNLTASHALRSSIMEHMESRRRQAQ